LTTERKTEKVSDMTKRTFAHTDREVLQAVLDAYEGTGNWQHSDLNWMERVEMTMASVRAALAAHPAKKG
jgi:phage tail protein X